MSKYIDGVAKALCQLDDKDIAVLLKGTDPTQARMIEAGLRMLRQRQNQPVKDVLPVLLDAMWQNGLRECVEAGLKCLSEGRPPWQPHPTVAL